VVSERVIGGALFVATIAWLALLVGMVWLAIRAFG
jgi:hypothetical protein